MLFAAIWGTLGLLLGVAAFIILPLILGILGGVELRDKLGRYYINQMMAVVGDAALVAREQGGLELTTVDFDPEFSADRASVAGKDGHLSDDLNLKSRLAGKPFGLALESHPVYISPLFAEFAEYVSNAKENGRLGLRPDGGTQLDFEIPDLPTVPDLRGTHRILEGDARRRFGVLSESWTAKSQEKFGKRVSLGQTMLLIIAFGVGSGMALLVIRYGTGSGGGGDLQVPIQISATALGVAL